MLFFIYGTLKKGGNNHSVLKTHAKKEKISTAFGIPVKTTHKFPMYASSYGFPFLMKKKGLGDIISGELWDIKDGNIHYMDDFEGTPDLYTRGKIDLIDEKTSIIYKDVQVYFETEQTDIRDNPLISEWEI